MADLPVLAIGFGALPLSSIILYSFRDWIDGHREIVWGGLAGGLAFLGLSHGMAHVLESKAFLFGGGNGAITILFLLIGLGLGATAGWFLFEGPLIGTETAKITWAAVAFLAIHSVGDGLVLGRDFAGGLSPVVQVDALTVLATVTHRFIEGAIVLVAAVAAGWRAQSSFVALFVSLSAIPAAFLPSLLTGSMGLLAGSSATTALSTFLAAIETAFVLLLLLRGFLPMAGADRGTRWIAWTAVGFIGTAFLHFLVE